MESIEAPNDNRGTNVFEKYCTQCGFQLAASAKFCSECGTKQHHLDMDNESMISPIMQNNDDEERIMINTNPDNTAQFPCAYNHCGRMMNTKCQRCNRWICLVHLKSKLVRERVFDRYYRKADYINKTLFLCPDCMDTGVRMQWVLFFVFIAVVLVNLLLIIS